MPATGRYAARYDRALRTSAKAAAGGRLSGAVPVTITALDGPGTRIAPGPYQLMGPGDVAGLAAGAVVRRFPSPGSSDAEETKLPLVEFGSADLPWRYTPVLPDGPRLPPWLVLVVAPPGPDGLSLRPDGSVVLGAAAQATHPLAESWRWAHVHTVGTFRRSRLLSPVDLASLTGYQAVLVPAFTADGAPAWTGTAAVTLRCLDSWSFRTGERGDFPDLAEQLRRADLAALAARGGRPFGRADLRYRPRDGGHPVVLPTAGALRVPVEAGVDPADGPPPDAVAADVAALLRPIAVPDGRPVVTAPDYPAAFTATGTAPVDGGWTEQLTDDPRLRGAAGLGAWTAIAWQDRIADAAARRLGDTVLAADRIRALALGVAASRSLWRRRVPPDPAGRLAVLAPALGRLPTDDGRTVLEALRGRHPQFGPALLSSAGRRAARPGPARASGSGAGWQELLGTAAQCPDPTEPQDVDPLAPGQEDPTAAALGALQAATPDPWLAQEAMDRLVGGGAVDPSALAAVLTALTPGDDGYTDREAVRRLLDSGDFERLDPGSVAGWSRRPDEHAPPCRPIDLDRVGEAVAAAVDPTVPVPPAARRVFATLPGITSMGPVEVEPELDLPLWSFLSEAAPDWMLPGVGDLAEHEVVGVQTNPAFVRALLAGANHQSVGELRWRNVPLVPRSSPLRRFWQRPAGQLDIRPIRGWPSGTALADPALADTTISAGSAGSEAVVVFRSPLFRRYPSTVVYLSPAGDGWPAPGPDALPHVDPTFTGTIGPDVTFFGFPLPVSALRDHWVVLEEPPAGYRFFAAPQPDVPEVEQHAGDVAHRRFALPVRVLLGPLL